MKLETILIENFRGIERVELSFLDELERVQDVVPIVGPNTSGKTSILDAITLCLGPVTELWTMRPDLVYSPASLVRRGAVRAHVACTVRFSDAEIEKTREVFERTGLVSAAKIPSENRVTIHWEYPDPSGKHELGLNRFDPAQGYLLFKGRKNAVRNFHVPGVSARDLQHLGGVFMFDQKRTGLGHRTRSQRRAQQGMADGTMEPSIYTRDPRRILLDIATRAQAPQHPEATEREDFERLCQLYARVCQPHRIKGLFNTESGLDMEFEGPGGIYLFDGLSSGQLMLLMLLLQFARSRIHQSIVLIDELELHLHPLWQTRLFTSLRDLGTENQIFFTTHSMHLRDMLRGTVFHATGELGDAVEKKEV
jgi:energy-coupling factor transporter ATP-binding protein EcfA2